MTKVSNFVVMGYDGFSWSVALRRHEYLKKGVEMDWLQREQVAQDLFSTLIGAPGNMVNLQLRCGLEIWPDLYTISSNRRASEDDIVDNAWKYHAATNHGSNN